MMDAPDLAACLHVCSVDASAGAIKWMLRHEFGTRRPPVIYSHMMENVGPLRLLDQPRKRYDWFLGIGFEVCVYQGLTEEGAEAVVGQWTSFWTRIDEWDGPILFWFSGLSAQDQSLLLSVYNRVGCDRPIFVVDVSEPAGDLPGATAVAAISSEKLRMWIPKARKVDGALAETLKEHYAALVSSPKDIRLFSGGDLVETPKETLDARILSQFSPEWRPLTRAAAEIPGAFGAGGFRDMDFVWLLWRLEELRKAGRIEQRGGGFDPEFKDNPLGGDVRLLT